MQITVTVDLVLYPKGGIKPENNFYIFRCDYEGKTLIGKGTMGWYPSPLEMLQLSGDFVEYKGEKQFKFGQAKITLPLDARAQLNYVAERTSGVGPKIAAAIWDARHDDWRNLERGEVRMSDAAFENFKDQIKAFALNAEKAEVISYLEGRGCTSNMASLAYDEWGSDTPGVVNNNCYRLAELPGVSFKLVDEKVRRNYGIEDDDPRRVAAAITYAFSLCTSDGSTAINWFVLQDKISSLLPNIAQELIERQTQTMIDEYTIRLLGDGYGALSGDYDAELAIWNFVQGARTGIPDEDQISEEKIQSLTAGLKFAPDAGQLAAVQFALSHRFSMINGGAGVGKTTIIKLIADAVTSYLPHLTLNLSAFAGKAAARLREATGRHSSTIHSMLGYNGATFSAGPLTNSVVVIDESSMVDAALLSEIAQRNPARLILVGDQAQLSPVGKGQPFHDLLELMPELVKTLTTCYRNKEAVFQAAGMLRSGTVPPPELTSAEERWVITPATHPEEAQRLVCAWAKSGYLDFGEDIILCPKNGKSEDDDKSFAPGTVNGLNTELLEIDRGLRGMGGRSEKFLSGDRVINTKNYPENHVWNGTTGTVSAVNQEGEVFITLDIPAVDTSRTIDPANPIYIDTVKFTRDMAKHLRYAYALTVHKSQGSQYRQVVVICLARDKFILTRSLVYTAVTRTRENCVVVGDQYALQHAVGSVKSKDTVLQYLAGGAR